MHEELIGNAIAFLAGWVLKRPDFVQKIVSKLFAKKDK
jgi:predicted membrane protein